MIEAERCHIGRTTCRDISGIWALYRAVDVWAYLGGRRGLRRSIAGVVSRVFPGEGCLYWTVRCSDTGAFLGNVSLGPHHDEEHTEVSYEFLPAAWGKGYATEAVGAAETQAANAASCAMLHKLGFREAQRVNRFGEAQIIFIIKK